MLKWPTRYPPSLYQDRYFTFCTNHNIMYDGSHRLMVSNGIVGKSDKLSPEVDAA